LVNDEPQLFAACDFAIISPSRPLAVGECAADIADRLRSAWVACFAATAALFRNPQSAIEK
jgi:hypothetical protein